MRWEIKGRRAEWAMDVAAAAILAAAVGFALSALAADADLASSAAMIAFMLALAILRHVTAGGRAHARSAFRPAPIEQGEEARGEIVRLSCVSRRRGAREYNASVARTVRPGRSMTAAPDATQALSDALAELRRSLR